MGKAMEFHKEAIRLEEKIRLYVKDMVEKNVNEGETLTFIMPCVTFLYGAPQQINGLIRTTDGRIKAVINDWNEEDYPTYYTLSVETMLKIASKLEMGMTTKQVNEKQNG